MYCKNCGAQNDDNALQCSACGASLRQVPANAPPSEKVPNYLVQAILVTIFCCLPFGIVAIIFAAQVNSKLEAGNYAGALESSKKAKTWTWVAFGVGLVFIVGYLLLMFLGVGMGFLSRSSNF